MEETTTIKIRDIVTELHTGNQYRIIYLQDDCIVLCKMQCSRLITTIYTTSQLLTRLALRECSISAQSNSVCDYTAVRREKIQEFEHRKAIVRRIRETYGPDYMELSTHNPKPLLEQLAAQYRVSRCSILRWIRVYLQGGMDDNVLFDRRLTPKRGINRCYRRKPGRPCKAGLASGIVPSAQMREHFADALMQLKSGRAKTYQYAYNYLCSRYYSVSAAVGSDGNLRTQVLPISERPTFAQFYYYGRKQLGREEMDAIRTSRREQRNDKRVLLSDSLNGILGPWDCFEMDECEIDVSLVSVENPSVVVGRPIVYIFLGIQAFNRDLRDPLLEKQRREMMDHADEELQAIISTRQEDFAAQIINTSSNVDSDFSLLQNVIRNIQHVAPMFSEAQITHIFHQVLLTESDRNEQQITRAVMRRLTKKQKSEKVSDAKNIAGKTQKPDPQKMLQYILGKE